MARTKKIEQPEKKEKIVKVKKVENPMTIAIYNLEGKETGTADMPKEILETKVNKNLLAQYVRVYLANQRLGSASTKTRSEVTGSTKKIYRQKGTGRARHGARKASLFKGGGVTGGPLPRDYSLKMNKKQKRKALLDALYLKFKEGSLIGLSREAGNKKSKTKEFANFLKNLKINKNKIVFVMPEKKNEDLYLSVRNIERVLTSPVNSVNPYLLLTNQKVIFLEDAWDNFKNYFFNSANK